jgi:hypothetical protein
LKTMGRAYITREDFFPCPCCGYKVHNVCCGYKPCPICRWEDSPEQLRNPFKALAPNRISLLEAQGNFMQSGVSNALRAADKNVPKSTDMRDSEWRPIYSEDSFDPPDISYPLIFPPDIPYSTLYYWSPNFWNRKKATVTILPSLLNLLGKSRDSHEMQSFLKTIPEAPSIDNHRDISYFSFRCTGISLSYDKRNNTVETVFLYNQGYEGFTKYSGELPCGVTFQVNRADVRSKLGEPVRGGLRRGPTPAVVWDLYEVGPFLFHFEFDHASGLLNLVTLSLRKDFSD